MVQSKRSFCGIILWDWWLKVKFLSRLNSVLIKIFCRKTPLQTHLLPMHPFSTPWNFQKTLRFSDVFRESRKGALETNGLNRDRNTCVEHISFCMFLIHVDYIGRRHHLLFFEMARGYYLRNKDPATSSQLFMRYTVLLICARWYWCFSV